MTYADTRRVVVTGMGAISPHGLDLASFWRGCLQGTPAIRPIRRFPVADLPIQVAGEVPDFQAERLLVPAYERKFLQRTDRVTHFACAAVEEARRDARLDLAREDPRRVGVVIANTLGGVEFVVEQMKALYTQGPRAMSAYTAIAWLQVANAGQVALHYGLQGFTKTPVGDTVGGLEALAMATDALRRGSADILFAGGCEALLMPLFLLIFGESGLSASGTDPRAYRPFDQRACGLILAEGAGICVLEEYEHARRRHAPIYGEILGFGQTSSARPPLPTSADGTYYARAIRLALQDADLWPGDIDYFSLDGRADPAADLAEASALQEVFGTRALDLPASVPRTTIGHSYAAAGALDTIATLLTLRSQQIPPMLNCDRPDPRYALNLVRDQARPLTGSTALVGARSFSGSNVVLALRGEVAVA